MPFSILRHTSFGLNSMERHGNKRTKTIFDFFKSSGEVSKVGNLSPSVIEASSREETRPLESPTREVYVDYNSLERDPGLRTPIRQYSPHRNSVQSVENLSNVTRHIDRVINAQTSEDVRKNRLRLKVTSEVVRWLSLQGCAVRGHREGSTSENRGNLIEMLKLMGRLNVNIEDVILDNAPGNAKYTSPNIQKEILHIMANMVRKKIREEIGDKKFCLLVDEAKDAGGKEEMAIVLRFVDGQGSIKERFSILSSRKHICFNT
ncbi:hypothetical protein Syun_026957 [Stephania yunnanensis]|uniref:DUF4371 domain-containing protein n=1 Tax=Stephania yunnanensis TaxID=152371 RepID=A0AAP0EER3_9MAGN